jgi:hypothetical protein
MPRLQTEKRRGNTMLKIIAIALATMLMTAAAFAQSDNNSGAGVPGKPGSKSGPAMTKSGPSPANQSGTNTDQSKVPGKPGSKSGPAVKPPK